MAIYSKFQKPAFQALLEKKFIKNASFGGQSFSMQRSYRVRNDLANATLTNFLLETNYPPLRGMNRLDIKQYTVYKFGVQQNFGPKFAPFISTSDQVLNWASEQQIYLQTIYPSPISWHYSSLVVEIRSLLNEPAVLKTISQKTQLCDFISLDACTRVSL